MSIKYYRTAFESDIFYQKQQDKPLPQQKFIFNYDLRPKDKVSSLSAYMEKEQPPKEMYHIKVFTSKATDVLNTSKFIPREPREYGVIHHLSKSQISLGEHDESSFILRPKPKPKSVEKYPQEEQSTAFQRKMSEFYGGDYLRTKNFATISHQHHSSLNFFKKEVYPNYSVPENKRSLSTICLSQSSKDDNQPSTKTIKVTKSNKNLNPANISHFSNRIDFLKSNIFNDLDTALRNEYNTITQKERAIKVDPIKDKRGKFKKALNRSFELGRDDNRQLDYRPNSKLNAKERRKKELYSSFDTIPIQYTTESSTKNFFDTKSDLESQAISHFKGTRESAIKKQLENVSALNGSGFYSTNYKLNSVPNDSAGVIHKYEIKNVKDQDIKRIKQCFTNNSIHLYDTILQDYEINTNEPKKIIVKIRANQNDENFPGNLLKAKERLKKSEGLELKKANKSTCLQSKQESKGMAFKPKCNAKRIKAKESLTSIPYDVKYKNDFFKR